MAEKEVKSGEEIRYLSAHFNAETNRDAIMTGSLVIMGISR